MYQRALAGYGNNPQYDLTGQLLLYYNMGLLFRRLAHFEKAIEFLKQAHEGFKKMLGPEHPETVDALNDMEQARKMLNGHANPDESTEKQG